MTDPVVRAHFDRVAPEYESNRLGGWYVAHGRFIADRLAGRRFAVALDVGCATGWLLRELVRRDAADRGVGLDLAPRMVEEAERRAREAGLDGRLEFHVGDWPAVAPEVRARLAELTPDLAVFASSLHYADGIASWLEAAADVLAPGGTVVVFERAPERSLLTRAWGRAHRSLLRDGASFSTSAEVRAALSGAGFEDVETTATLRRWFWRGKAITSMALTTGRRPA